MDDRSELGYGTSGHIFREIRLEEDEEEFRSCCEEDDEVWKDTEVPVKEESKDEFDEFSVKMFFKGLSIAEVGDSSSGLSGIGVVMERSTSIAPIQVQKKLRFFVEEPVSDYLALMDGLVEAVENKVRRVYAFTDSELLYNQMTKEEGDDVPLLSALRQRVLEHAINLEAFVLKLVKSKDLERPLQLAQVAIGIVSSPVNGDMSHENCCICCEDKPSPMMITMKCSHKFCSHCMKTHVDGKVQSSQVPIKCPQVTCRYYISATECSSFLPLALYESLAKALAEANILNAERIYCPFPNCSALIDSRISSSQDDDNNCIECPVCLRFICVECEVPWHSSVSCEEFRNLPLEERDASDIACVDFIFSSTCGAECSDSHGIWREEDDCEDLVTQSLQEWEQWDWEAFYSDQERSQLALVQRFLAGGLSVSDHETCQPHGTDSYVEDAMKDLHQLPWLERFVSVISDDYYEDYFQ